MPAMTKCSRLIVLLALAIVVASCAGAAPAPADTSADVAKIGELRAAWAKAFTAGDTATLATLYTDDAVVMPENDGAVVGKEAVLKMWTDVHAQYKCDATLASDETKVMGDWAFDRGQFTMILTPKTPPDPKTLAPGTTGQTMEMGKYIVILQKQADGSWKIAREIGNANGPIMQH
jgi:uncharacterized protein (TIGR02246 family)